METKLNIHHLSFILVVLKEMLWGPIIFKQHDRFQLLGPWLPVLTGRRPVNKGSTVIGKSLLQAKSKRKSLKHNTNQTFP